MTPPVIVEHEGIMVARDDFFPGGTKSRYIPTLFDGADEVVYASPAQGGAQFALAYCARQLAKRATIFVAKRRVPHDRLIEARALGAKVIEVANGYLSVVQARARQYCEETGAKLAPFGMDIDCAEDAIASAACSIGVDPEEVWCSCGSGVLTRALQAAWPRAAIHYVIVGGRNVSIEGCHRHDFPRPFEWRAPQPPFPSDPHYDAKAWMFCQMFKKRAGHVLMWNVTGPAITSWPSLAAP